MNIIAYTYEADTHCIACTKQRYQDGGFDTLYKEHPNYNEGLDANGVGMDAMDYEGNAVHPLFSTDSWQEYDEGFLVDNPTQYLTCGDCHEIIDEYTHIKQGFTPYPYTFPAIKFQVIN